MILGISLILTAVLGIAGIIIAFDDDYDSRVFGIISSFFTLIVFILILIQIQHPTAMDVYRGKTTLEITYKDGAPVDSVVVWKSK